MRMYPRPRSVENAIRDLDRWKPRITYDLISDQQSNGNEDIEISDEVIIFIVGIGLSVFIGLVLLGLLL